MDTVFVSQQPWQTPACAKVLPSFAEVIKEARTFGAGEGMATNYWSSTSADTAGLIEIVDMPRMFYIHGNGAPDNLFYSLLTSARDAILTGANSMLWQQGAKSNEVSFYARLQMAGMLLCEQSFVAIPRQNQSSAHRYKLDFKNGTIQLRTELYALVEGISCLLRITMEGSMLGKSFAVYSSTSDRLLVDVTEEDLQKSTFFTEELPLRAYQSQRSARRNTVALTSHSRDQAYELLLQIPMIEEIRSIVLKRNKGEAVVRLVDAKTNTLLKTLPWKCLEDLDQIIEVVRASLEEDGNQSKEPSAVNDSTQAVVSDNKVAELQAEGWEPVKFLKQGE